MRLILLYAAQVAFIVAGFAAVSSVFVSINSDAMSSTVTQLLSSTATLATAQAVAPLDKFSVQVVAWADMLYANPALLCSDPTSVEWTPENVSVAASASYVPSPSFRVTPGKEIKLSFHRNNPLARYVYEYLEMPDNSSQKSNCGTLRSSTLDYTFYTPSLHRRGTLNLPDVVNCEGNVSVNAEGRLTPAFFQPGWTCEQVSDGQNLADPVLFGWDLYALTKNDSSTGQWTGFYSYWDPVLNAATPLLTFAIPLTFSKPDPVTGAYRCTDAAAMDLNGQWLADALRTEVLDGVDLAMFWDADETLVAWTLHVPTADNATGAVLAAGATHSQFDDAVTAFHNAAWCSGGTGELSACDTPTDKSSVSNSRYVFALRRVVHINARFTIVISGDRDTFFGPGERARAVGIGVSVAVCVVCLATSVMLWLTTVRPLRRLIGNMELASTFSSDVDAEGDSCITEVNEANVAFLSMHEQLQMAKPFMPQHLLEQFEEDRRDHDADTSDMQSAPQTGDDTRTVVSSSWRSRSTKRSARRSAEHNSVPVTKRSSNHSGGRGIAVVALESRFVAVLVINVTAFDKLVRGLTSVELQAHYAKFIDAVLQVTRAHRGVLDSAQGDHIIVSFNTTLRCAAPAAKAVNAAFALRAALVAASLPTGWQRITCGVSAGHAHCGTLGSSEAKSHATLGTVVRQAVGLQRVARALDDQRREAAAATADGVGNDVSVAPGWCVGTARVVQDCVTFAHYRYEAVASLPPSGRTTVIASIFPPVDVTNQPNQVHHAHDAAAEWLYAVSATASRNLHAEHNDALQSKFISLTNIAPEISEALLKNASSWSLNAAVSAVTVPQLAPL